MLAFVLSWLAGALFGFGAGIILSAYLLAKSGVLSLE